MLEFKLTHVKGDPDGFNIGDILHITEIPIMKISVATCNYTGDTLPSEPFM